MNYLTRKNKKFYQNITIRADHHECGMGKGGDIWGNDWPIPVAEEFEWHFYDDTSLEKQYVTTCLTDYILGFIPFTYDQYVYELPAGTFQKGELTTKKVADLIYFLEHWNWHTDQVYCDDRYEKLVFFTNGYKESKEYITSDHKYQYIRTKEN